MRIDRDNLIQEMIIRKFTRKALEENCSNWVIEQFPKEYSLFLEEKQLRNKIKHFIPRIINEEMSDEKALDMAIDFVRKTLLDIIKIVSTDQSKFDVPEVQDGFKKAIMLSLSNHFQEKEAEFAKQNEPEPEKEVLEEENDGLMELDVKVAKEDPMFIDLEDNPEEEQEEPDDDSDLSDFEREELETYASLNSEEKIGFNIARETWKKISNQIDNTLEVIEDNEQVYRYYKEWLTKNIGLHIENTKEETAKSPVESESF